MAALWCYDRDVRALTFVLKLAAGALAAFLLAGCGNFFPSSHEIVSIRITPTSFYVLVDGTAQFTANGTFGNNSTGDVTKQVTWSSSDTSIATIDSSGKATAAGTLSSGQKFATTSISAKSGSVNSNNAAMTVATLHVMSMSVSPGSQTITSGSQFQFTATATLTDNTGINATNISSWSSSNSAVATVSSTGLVTAVSPGSATITASLDNQNSSGSLTVQ